MTFVLFQYSVIVYYISTHYGNKRFYETFKYLSSKNYINSCLENSIVRGTCWATGHGVAKSWTRLSTHTHVVSTFSLKIAKMKPTPIDRCLISFYNSFPHTFKRLNFLIKEYWKIKIVQRATEVSPSTTPRGEQNATEF